MKNKKGVTLTQTTLVVVIIAIMIFAILFVFLNEVRKHAEDQADSKKCKLEVLKASEFAKYIGKLKKFVYAKCPAKDLGTLELSDNIKKAKKESAIIIADEMVDCWDKFGEGKLRPFPGEFVDRQTHCYVCSTFKMPETSYGSLPVYSSLKAHLEINTDQKDFLKDAFLYEDPSGFPIFGLNSLSIESGVFKKPDSWAPSFESKKTYYLINIFIVDKESKGWWFVKPFTAAAGITTAKTHSKLALIKPENINNVCLFLEN